MPTDNEINNRINLGCCGCLAVYMIAMILFTFVFLVKCCWGNP